MRKTGVFIAGAGPGGVTTALSLANRGISCVIAERSPAPVVKAGETIAPNAIPLFDKTGIGALLHHPSHLKSYGNRYCWGSRVPADKDFVAGTQSHGYHLDRLIFERQLTAQAEETGVVLLSGWSIVSCIKLTNGWTVTIQNEQKKQEEIFSEYIVDATGRSCRIARSLGIPRIRVDQLTGVAACFKLSEYDHPHYTFIEAVEDGWWYAAPLTGNRLATTFLTDADVLQQTMLDTNGYLQMLESTEMIANLLNGKIAQNNIGLSTYTASTSYLERRYGDGWLAVGDAAFAYDPISSFGITSAIEGGFYGGNAIADALAGSKEALPAYDYITSSAFTIYKEMHVHQYQLEQRWPEQIFWKRRIGVV